MSATVLMLYERPIDPDAFSQYFQTTHLTLLKAIPDLRSIDVARGEILGPQGPAPYYQIVTLTFGSMDDLKSALSSGAGEAALRDIVNFATGGSTVVMFENQSL